MAGYTRVILAGISLTYMSYHPKYCTLLYGISSLLDAVDGQVARALGQSSRFGAVLDMVTDRCGAGRPLAVEHASLYAQQMRNDVLAHLPGFRIPSLAATYACMAGLARY